MKKNQSSRRSVRRKSLRSDRRGPAAAGPERISFFEEHCDGKIGLTEWSALILTFVGADGFVRASATEFGLDPETWVEWFHNLDPDNVDPEFNETGRLLATFVRLASESGANLAGGAADRVFARVMSEVEERRAREGNDAVMSDVLKRANLPHDADALAAVNSGEMPAWLRDLGAKGASESFEFDHDWNS